MAVDLICLLTGKQLWGQHAAQNICAMGARWVMPQVSRCHKASRTVESGLSRRKSSQPLLPISLTLPLTGLLGICETVTSSMLLSKRHQLIEEAEPVPNAGDHEDLATPLQHAANSLTEEIIAVYYILYIEVIYWLKVSLTSGLIWLPHEDSATLLVETHWNKEPSISKSIQVHPSLIIFHAHGACRFPMRRQETLRLGALKFNLFNLMNIWTILAPAFWQREPLKSSGPCSSTKAGAGATRGAEFESTDSIDLHRFPSVSMSLGFASGIFDRDSRCLLALQVKV